MKQLNIFCEGQTEQGFSTQVLQPHLFPRGEGIIHTLAVGAKDHHHVYGLGKRRGYEKIRKFICNTIRQREKPDVCFTTLFDLYALPTDFPGMDVNKRSPANPTPYVEALEAEFRQSINHPWFIPYLQLHEYETMLFADPAAFAIAFENCDHEIQQLKDIAASVHDCIELINDGKDTAPRKGSSRCSLPTTGAKRRRVQTLLSSSGWTRFGANAPTSASGSERSKSGSGCR